MGSLSTMNCATPILLSIFTINVWGKPFEFGLFEIVIFILFAFIILYSIVDYNRMKAYRHEVYDMEKFCVNLREILLEYKKSSKSSTKCGNSYTIVIKVKKDDGSVWYVDENGKLSMEKRAIYLTARNHSRYRSVLREIYGSRRY